MRTQFPEKITAFGLLCLQTLTMCLVAVGPWVQGLSVYLGPPQYFHQWIAAIFLFIGVFLFLYSTWELGRSFTPQAIPRDSGELKTNWPYSRVRNPLYTGIISLGFGWTLWCWSWLALVLTVLMIFALYQKVLFEERQLSKKFGEHYLRYCQKVGRFFPRFSR